MTLKYFAVIIDTLFVVTIFLINFSAKDSSNSTFRQKKILQLIVYENYLLRALFLFLNKSLFVFIKRGDLTALGNRRCCVAPHRREIS